MTKYCSRCKLAIDTNKEEYIIIENKKGKEQLSKVWLHKSCWKELMSLKEQTKKLQDNANKIIKFAQEKLGMEESYSI